ncbi:MAG: hypothetical protein ACP5UA_01385 [Candidatus Hydrogenedens sp.]
MWYDERGKAGKFFILCSVKTKTDMMREMIESNARDNPVGEIGMQMSRGESISQTGESGGVRLYYFMHF